MVFGIQVHDAFKKISSELGAPEVLCYNAGPTVGPPFPPPLVEDMDLARFRQGLELGVVGAFIWCKEVKLHIFAEFSLR